MKWLRVILLCLLLVPGVSRAQVAWEKEEAAARKEQIARQGIPLKAFGVGMAYIGGATVLSGGALLGLGYYASEKNPSEDNIAAGMCFALGVGSMFIGALELISCVPFIVGGNAMNKCDDYWDNLYYLGPPQSDFGLILEGGLLIGMPAPCAQARIVPGYHFNQHLFVGLGVAPTMDFDKANEYYSPFTLPVFADARYSFGNKLFAPYVGAGIGMETYNEPNIYLSAEAGLRIRLSQSTPRSFWVSALGETSAAYARLGLKMGYSF